MYPSAPFEYKRLEYQLRVDAATKCPGTVESDDAPDEPPEDQNIIERLVSRVSAVVLSMTAPLRTRKRAKAH
jgi:hypothetical protein